MHTAGRLTGLTESVIREMTRLAEKHNALNLSQGFPDFDPPPQVLDAAAEALRSGYNQYAVIWGSARLRAALASKYARQYDMDVDPRDRRDHFLRRHRGYRGRFAGRSAPRRSGGHIGTGPRELPAWRPICRG